MRLGGTLRTDHGVWSTCWHVWRGWARTYIILRSDMDWWSGWTEVATNSCKISCSNAERRGTPLYWINSYNTLLDQLVQHFTGSTRTTLYWINSYNTLLDQLVQHFTGSTRTTNALEAFHHSFNLLVACQHPSIWVLLKSLQRQQALTDNMLSHIAQGETKLPGTREREHAMLATLVSAYDRSDPEKTLRGIALNYMT